MKIFILLQIILSITSCDIVCGDKNTYLKVTKQASSSFAIEESYEIYDGTTKLITSPTFADNELRVSEYCINENINKQYTLKLKDYYGDSWGSNSWIMIQGIYDNIVFKNYMTADREEIYTISLYYGILKGEYWKVEYNLQSIASDWTAVNFMDSNWHIVNLNVPFEITSGSQYFRKSFNGLASMSAYEVEMYYKYGIIVYINGIEIFRDNMPEGAVTPSTLAINYYQDISYHGIIRPGNEVSNSNSILAVELHFLSSPGQSFINFDAYLAIYASSLPEDNCYIYPYSTTITGNGNRIITTTTNEQTYYKLLYPNIRDYTSYYLHSNPITINYEFSGTRPYLNGLKFWLFAKERVFPTSFKWQTLKNNKWFNLLSTVDQTYTSIKSTLFTNPYDSSFYKSYRLTISDMTLCSQSLDFVIQPLICALQIPNNIEFTYSSYSIYAKYQKCDIRPKLNEFTNCSITPTLPNGLILNTNTCTISGIATTTSPMTIYTMTSIINNQSYQGTFNLEVINCIGTVTQLVRTYQNNAAYESLSIRDLTTDQYVLTIGPNSGQINNEDITYTLCLTGSNYIISVGSTSIYWQAQSYIYINVMLSDTDYETLRRIRYDTRLGVPINYVFNINYLIKPNSEWYYKMGEIPTDWYNSETDEWSQSSMGLFPSSSNQIQLYKYNYIVNDNENSAAVVISLRYKYGCIIYMNNHEVFRNGIDGAFTNTSLSTNIYDTIQYRQISLPIKAIPIDETSRTYYVSKGNNTISIGIIASNGNDKTSLFDCAIRLIGEKSVSRVFDYTIYSNNIDGYPKKIADHYYDTKIYDNLCRNNNLDIIFNNDRREWISSITIGLYYDQNDKQPTQFTVKARNNNNENWTTIKTVTGMIWSLTGQQKKLWFTNNKPYNQYRLENFSTNNTNNCDWELGFIDLSSDSTIIDFKPITYPLNNEIYVNIEMGEVYPSSEYYYDFRIKPELPKGIILDPNNGMLSGTAIEETESITYTINAIRFGSGDAALILKLAAVICTGNKGLVTLVIKTDNYPQKISWQLFNGTEIVDKPIRKVSQLTTKNALNYADFCLPHNIYTIQIIDSAGNGMSSTSGYYLTVDVGEMVIETGQLPRGSKGGNSISLLFTTTIPFQIEYDDWYIWNGNDLNDPNWNTIGYDSSSWLTMKAAKFGPHIGTTAYIRHEVNIPDINKYHVLNVRVKYAGGLVAYFNGRKVARFNLEEHFDSTTEALNLHDSSLFSKFHIILPTVGAINGNNVIAFEIHRSSSESRIIFDATGIFGVNDCSVVVDSYSEIKGDVNDISANELFDLKPQTSGYITNLSGSSIEWIVENLEGSKYNSFGILNNHLTYNLNATIYGRHSCMDPYMFLVSVTRKVMHDRERIIWPMDVGLAGFKRFKLMINSDSYNSIFLSSFVFYYDTKVGKIHCPGIDDYPSVSEGRISSGPCPEFMYGYSYRICENGQLSDIYYDRCFFYSPDKLSYRKRDYEFVMDTNVTTGIPSFVNKINKFYISEDTTLPQGLKINENTGEISGIPEVTCEPKTIIIYGSNSYNKTATAITIFVRHGICPSEGVFKSTLVGEVFIFNCSALGRYLGVQKRACVIGDTDGKWKEATGICLPLFGVMFIVVNIILFIIVGIIVAIRFNMLKEDDKKSTIKHKQYNRRNSSNSIRRHSV